ncbi:MAG TPA: hypothetical protein VEQ10_19950 [Vicinamibacteria bacterium]|nr:hypothetical protein [Vicinamibacteria bacterium]
MRAARALAFYGAEAALCVALLAALPPLRGTPLAVPITHERDGLFLTLLTKAIHEDGFRHAARFGAPFGTDLVDWPLGMWLPFSQLSLLTTLLGDPGSAINAYWMSTIVMAALLATYALRRLRLGPLPSLVLGVLYAFQPYAFYRNVEHVNLAFPLVPLLALLTLRVAGVAPPDESRGERTLMFLACVGQALSYVYYSVFTCALLVFAAPIGWLRTRQRRLLLQAGLAIALFSGSTALMLSPSLAYWHRHGHNPDLDYKPPAETDTYGLKLRHLLLPIAEHPLSPWRALAWQVEAVDFPGDNENQLSKLGTLGSLGLLALLAWSALRAVGATARMADERLAAAAALTLVSLLLANVGGLASLFSVFVSPDVRCWDRIVVFVSFYCLLAVGALFSRAQGALGPRWRRPGLALAAAAALLVAGAFDQVPLVRLSALRLGTAEAWAEERDFVQAIESRLPRGAMVFQLPSMTVPVDRATEPPMLYYDPGRLYLHSRALRWSWGAMIGRHHDWTRAVAALPAAEQVRVLALAGFSGIAVDRWGYTGTKRPPFASLETELTAATGERFVASGRGRYSFVSLEPYRARLLAELGTDAVDHWRQRLLADMPISRWRTPCGEETHAADGWWSRCGDSAALELRNWRNGPIRVTLSARLRTAAAAVVRVQGPGFEDRLPLAPGVARDYSCVFDMDGTDTGAVRLTHPRSALVGFTVDPPRPAASRGGLEVGDLAIETRRLIDGVPVNADGGVAVRTKY